MIPLNIASRKSPNEDKTIYHLVIAHQERLDFEQMCKLIAERTTLSEHEVEFALSELQDIIIENLKIGRGVELGRLGRIEPSINVKSVDNIKDINLKTIKKAHLIYEPSKAIKAALSTLKYKIKK